MDETIYQEMKTKEHIKYLELSIKIAQSSPDNEEFYWYGPWSIVLNYWSIPDSTTIPQYRIEYHILNRDDNKIHKEIIPDFAMLHHYYKDNELRNCIELIVENKRACDKKDLHQEFKTHILQLEDQVGALFSNRNHNHIFTILAIGKYWRWYEYRYVKTTGHMRTWSDQSYGSKEPDDNYVKVRESKTLDISSNSYHSDFRQLIEYMK